MSKKKQKAQTVCAESIALRMHKVNDEVLGLLGLRDDWFIDNVLSVVADRPLIDIVKLDRAVHVRYPEYKDSVSMSEFITSRFGKEVAERIRELI